MGCRVFYWAVQYKILHTRKLEIFCQFLKKKSIVRARGCRHLCQDQYAYAFRKALPNILVGRCSGPYKWLWQKNTSAAYRWSANLIAVWQVWREHPFEDQSHIWYIYSVPVAVSLWDIQKYSSTRVVIKMRQGKGRHKSLAQFEWCKLAEKMLAKGERGLVGACL